MPDAPIDLDDVTDREVQHNLMWKFHKRTARWEKALDRVVRFHDLLAGAGWCFTRVAIGLVALASAVATFKGAWDVVVSLTSP